MWFGHVRMRMGVEVRRGASSRQAQEMFTLLRVGLPFGVYLDGHCLFRSQRRNRRRQFLAGDRGSLGCLSGDDLPRRLKVGMGLLEIGFQAVLVLGESLLDAVAQLRRRFGLDDRASDLFDERLRPRTLQAVSDEAAVWGLNQIGRASCRERV